MTLPKTPTDPAERREAFCQEYVRNGGMLFNAAVHAGYPRASAAVRANELMKTAGIQERIAELLRERFVVEGVKAHKVVLGLSKRSTQKDAVKLRAAKELMTLGGLFKKADAASHAADAEKRSKQETAAMCQEFAIGLQYLLTLDSASSGFQTGIQFKDNVFKVVNADDASRHLNYLWRGWTETLPARFGTGLTPNIYHKDNYEMPGEEVDGVPAEVEDEDWTAV
jgi:hypothetical protein